MLFFKKNPYSVSDFPCIFFLLFFFHAGSFAYALEDWEKEFFEGETSQNEETLQEENEEADGQLFPSSLYSELDLFYRNYQLRKGGPLHLEESSSEFVENKLQTGIDLSFKEDITPAFFVSSHVYGARIQEDTTVRVKGWLLEAYGQWSFLSERLNLTMGKEKLLWGNSYWRNPSDILIPVKDQTYDPYDIENQEGILLVRISYLFGKMKILLLVGEDPQSEHDNEAQAGARLSYLQEQWDVSLYYQKAGQKPSRLASSITSLITDSFELHGEWSRRKERKHREVVLLSEQNTAGNFIIPARYSFQEETEEKYYQEFLLGGQYTFTNQWNLIVEYYHNQNGYTQDEWDTVMEGIQSANTNDAWNRDVFSNELGNPYHGYLLQVAEELSKLDIRQNYLFFRLSNPPEKQWGFSFLTTINLDDQSVFHRSQIQRAWENKTLQLSAQLHHGDDENEFGLSAYSAIYTLGFRWYL